MLRLLIFLVLLVPSLAGKGFAQSGIPEYDLKASYLFNFAMFTEWPGKSEGPLNICVLGQDNFGGALKQLETKSVRGMPIALARLGSLSAIRKCDLLFVGEREAASMKQVMDILGDSPVLTVSEVATSPRAAITLVPAGNRLGFDIDRQRVSQARLQMSSKLLQLARTLY